MACLSHTVLNASGGHTEAVTYLCRLKDWATMLKRDINAIYLASRNPRVPWYSKALAVAVAGYALSPIDLIRISFRCWDIWMT